LAAASGAAAEEATVRVLLAQGPGPVEIDTADGHLARLTAAAGAVRRVEGETAPWIRFPAGPGLAVRSGGGFSARALGGDAVVWPTEGGLALVEEVPLEAYVAGTLAGELGPSWAPAVLEAQAVAVRSYVLHQSERRGERPWDVVADTESQVYAGPEAEFPAARTAAERTRGQVLVWQDRPILAAYHSASGGRTASAEEVWGQPLAYLVTQPVAEEHDSPDTYWRVELLATTLGRALERRGHPIGEVRRAVVRERSDSGRALRVAFEGSEGTAEMTGRELRSALGETVLRSTLFELRRGDAGAFVFVGSGYGHGVGMSQWGARGLARGGADYREILAHFYPGTALAPIAPAPPVAARGETE
ncbi:MAG: SpoIID/LytB domain-containing protein, partial [Proteobacteria bacterium]|nr:SpoIID/LytB domain-containing protein [Pseudomonadota bacterium]